MYAKFITGGILLSLLIVCAFANPFILQPYEETAMATTTCNHIASFIGNGTFSVFLHWQGIETQDNNLCQCKNCTTYSCFLYYCNSLCQPMSLMYQIINEEPDVIEINVSELIGSCPPETLHKNILSKNVIV